MIQEGLISMCLWGKWIRKIRRVRTPADMDREQPNSKKILSFRCEDDLATIQ